MIRVIALIFAPFRTWTKIAEAQRGVLFVLCLSFLPLMLGCVAAETYSLIHWGEPRGASENLVRISQTIAVRYAIAQVLLLTTCVFFSAYVLHAVAESFHITTRFYQSFAAVVYGISPLVLMRLLDAWPAIPSWGCWAFGVLLSISALYNGVALMLRPEQTKGLGLYLVTAIIIVLSTGVSHFVAQAVLHEKIFRNL
ncbi:MAG: DUF1282 domain-containing protein [Pedosphaera sp.]|nr:DUF1282 domain-containing protein [Pedosphaera sp.]